MHVFSACSGGEGPRAILYHHLVLNTRTSPTMHTCASGRSGQPPNNIALGDET